MKYVSFFILLICLFGFHSKAQERQYTFNNLSEKDGLRNNIIFSLLKDSHGILWVGTQNGLNRFDGSHFYTYKKKRDANSLPNNSINCLTEDKNGNIWGGTDNGVFCYSPALNQFTTFNAPKEAQSNVFSNIICDNQGDIYAASSIELLKFNRQKKEFQLLVALTKNIDSIPSYYLSKNRILKDEQNDGFWISTRNGLLFYNIRQNTLSSHLNKANSPIFELQNTSAIAKSPTGHFWIFDNQNKEIISFDPKEKKILKKISIQKEYPAFKATTIFEDSQNKL